MPDSIFVLNIHTVPNASQTQIIGIHGDALKIKVKAPPVDGKVNDEMIDQNSHKNQARARIMALQTFVWGFYGATFCLRLFNQNFQLNPALTPFTV